MRLELGHAGRYETRGIFLSNRPDTNELQWACLEEKCRHMQFIVAGSFRLLALLEHEIDGTDNNRPLHHTIEHCPIKAHRRTQVGRQIRAEINKGTKPFALNSL